MGVGVIVIAHEGFGPCLAGTLQRVLHGSPLPARVMSVGADYNAGEVAARLREAIVEIDSGDGVLLLTDLADSAPGRIALSASGPGVRVVAGANLPMLIEVMSHPELELEALARAAVQGGRSGVVFMETK